MHFRHKLLLIFVFILLLSLSQELETYPLLPQFLTNLIDKKFIPFLCIAVYTFFSIAIPNLYWLFWKAAGLYGAFLMFVVRRTPPMFDFIGWLDYYITPQHIRSFKNFVDWLIPDETFELLLLVLLYLLGSTWYYIVYDMYPVLPDFVWIYYDIFLFHLEFYLLSLIITLIDLLNFIADPYRWISAFFTLMKFYSFIFNNHKGGLADIASKISFWKDPINTLLKTKNYRLCHWYFIRNPEYYTSFRLNFKVRFGIRFIWSKWFAFKPFQTFKQPDYFRPIPKITNKPNALKDFFIECSGGITYFNRQYGLFPLLHFENNRLEAIIFLIFVSVFENLDWFKVNYDPDSDKVQIIVSDEFLEKYQINRKDIQIIENDEQFQKILKKFILKK